MVTWEFIGDFLLLNLQVLLTTIESMIKWLIPLSMRTKSLEGETMLITGAGSGIGRLFAQRFSALGVRVVLWDISASGVEETARMVRATGGKAWWFVCDVSKREKVNEAAEKVKQEVGDVTMLVNNAGIVTGKKFFDLTEEDCQRTLGVNSMAHIWTLKAFLPQMLEKNHGHVVTIASIMGELVIPGLSDYCMSKFAAVGLHECVMREVRALGKDGVHFTLVNPYKIDTGMFEGAHIRKSCEILIPTLKPEFVVKKVVEAVQTNQDVVRTPAIFNTVVWLQKMLPQQALFQLEDFLENDKAMNDFVGRRGQKTEVAVEDKGAQIVE
ncbi:retinol dehydrogenase 10-B-like [Diadema setosum]|uniref:retinol dehydrogenase 10-B-like n=1 Tax=Diadema setosum TaxID=31175 RepID=UPI003B3A5F8E